MTGARLEALPAAGPVAALKGSRLGKHLVLATVALLVVVRLFTEVLPILPGSLKLVDVPLLALLLAAAALEPATPSWLRVPGYAAPALAFFVAAVVSVLANVSRVAPGPVVLFLYGFLAPLAAYHATYKLWPAGNALVFSRLLVGLGVLQFVVVGVIQLPRFLSSGNPDDISGTFGENPYQLVFFLLVFCGLVSGIAVFERGRLSARAAPLLVVAALAVVFLAQYRALLAAAAVTMLVLACLLARAGGRGIFLGLFVVGVFVVVLAVVAVRFPTTKYEPYLSQVRQSPFSFVSDRVHALGGVADMYDAMPGTIPVGSGPGTFSSRSWETFASFVNPNRTPHDPVAKIVARLTGGSHYATDVSDRFSTPRYLNAQVVLGSRALNSPFSSYTSLLAEVGLLGFASIVFAYLRATHRAIRFGAAAMRSRERGDPSIALLVAAATAFVVLLQMALLGNWLEVTRITFPAWMLLAVGTKEFLVRGAGERA